ncbi:MAG: SLC13/DASS family transporter [Flavobacteriales bacterium]|nr:SLC13/DASS family transporter [Flavobacteriales bacterium]
MKRTILLLLGPLLAMVLYLVLRHLGHMQSAMAAVVLWMAVWWISEAVPLAITSLLPLILFPVLGIDSMAGAAANYGKEIIYLFLGGFLLALGIERSGLHRRIALHIVARVGGTGPRLIGGMLIACALLSMWMNSTSCVLVMLPIALSLLDDEEAPPEQRKLTVPLLLAVAYGATIGGMATPVGTPPNLIFLEIWRTRWPNEPAIGFGQWMGFGVPFMVIFLGIAWVFLTRVFFRVPTQRLVETTRVRERLRASGNMSVDEILSGSIFALTAILWITGDGLRFSEGMELRGWRDALDLKSVTDGAIAIASAILLFLIPSFTRKEKGATLLNWETAEKQVPWGILLLFGGGFAIASGIERSGLASTMVQSLAQFGDQPPVILVAAVSTMVCLISELGSNTATASLSLPILAESAIAWGISPQTLLIPATLAATLGFALPVASPMQAIVFGTGRIRVRDMVRVGIWMDLIGVLLLVLFFGLF